MNHDPLPGTHMDAPALPEAAPRGVDGNGGRTQHRLVARRLEQRPSPWRGGRDRVGTESGATLRSLAARVARGFVPRTTSDAGWPGWRLFHELRPQHQNHARNAVCSVNYDHNTQDVPLGRVCSKNYDRSGPGGVCSMNYDRSALNPPQEGSCSMNYDRSALNPPPKRALVP